jgi:hypothetical protein
VPDNRSPELVPAITAIARAVRNKDQDAERAARKQLLLAKSRIHRRKAAELIAAATP